MVKQSVWSLLLLLLSVGLVAAQASECEAFFEETMGAIDGNCSDAGRNEACYGYNQVSAAFTEPVSDDYFTSEADRTGIATLSNLATAPLNLDTGIWGLAVMNIQADVPNTLPGQAVTFVLMGDVEVENAVDPETAFIPSDGIETTVTAPAGANIRSGPSLNFNVIGGGRTESVLVADGTSEDGEWLRVIYNERPAWVSTQVVDMSVEGINDLPVLTPDLQTPMQAFYLRTGIGEPACEDFPDDILMVQGPENIEVSINANGADINIGSTLGLQTLIGEDGNMFLRAIAFAGEIRFMGRTLRPGQFSDACLGDAASRGLDGDANDLIVTCDPTDPQYLRGYGRNWCILEQVPPGLLNYRLNILCEGEQAPTSGGGGTGGGSPSQVDGYDCSGFSLISPLSATDSGVNTFSWTPVNPSDGEYQLVFFNFEGTEVDSFFTTDTSYSLNLGGTATGGSYTWSVRYYTANREYVCVTQTSPVLARTGSERQPDVNNPPPGGSFSAFVQSCGQPAGVNAFVANVGWTNAPSTPVTIEWNDFNITQSTSSGNTSGSTNVQSAFGANGINFINVIAGGQTINLPGC